MTGKKKTGAKTLFDRRRMWYKALLLAPRVLGNPACSDCSAYEVAPHNIVQPAAGVVHTYWLMLMTSLMLKQTDKHCLEYTKQSYHSSVKRDSQALSKAMPP